MEKILPKSKSRKKIEFLFIFIAMLVLVRYGFQIDIPRWIMLISAIAIVAMGSIDEIIAICLCCAPLYSAFDYLYVLLVGCMMIILKNYRKMKVDFVIFPIILLCMWELLHSFTGELDIKYLIAIFLPYFFALLLHTQSDFECDYEYVTFKFSFFVAGMGITLLVNSILSSGMDLISAINNLQRLGDIREGTNDIIGGGINPNSFGIMAALAIAVVMQNYFYVKKDKKKIAYIMILTTLGMLTLSRTFIALLILTLVLFLWQSDGGIIKKIKRISVVAISFSGGIFIFLKFFPVVVDSFVGRWLENDLSNGRLTIMSEATEVIWNNPQIALFGIGLQGYSDNVLKYMNSAPHDAIHEIIMAWGMPGLIFFLSFLIAVVLGARKKNKNMRLINFIPLIIIIAKAVAGHFITSGYTMIMVPLIYLSLAYDFTSFKIRNKEAVNRVDD